MTTLFLVASLIAVEPFSIEVRSERVGEFIVRGNSETGNSEILDVLYEYGFQTGGVVPPRINLVLAEIELAWKFRDRFALFLGMRPTIRILPLQLSAPNNPPRTVYRDIEVQFPEGAPKVLAGLRLVKD